MAQLLQSDLGVVGLSLLVIVVGLAAIYGVAIASALVTIKVLSLAGKGGGSATD